MQKVLFIFLVILMIGMAAGCTADANEFKQVADESGEVAGFWMGLWQGFIAPFTFIISLFNKSLGIYELHNNGNWYNFGFMLGLSVIMGGGSKSTCRRRKRKN